MFFFIINIVAFYTIYHWGERIKNIEFRRVFWLIFLIIAAREAVGNARKFIKPISIYTELEPTGTTVEEWLPYIDTSKYQAILPIPYYHLGSEYLSLEVKGSTLAYNLFPAYYGNMPSMAVMMSRTSWQQTLNSAPLGMKLYKEPPVLKELPNQKPLLIIEYKQWHTETGYFDQILLDLGKKIYENKAFAFYEFPLDGYQKAIKIVADNIKREAKNPALHKNGNLLTIDSTVNFVYKTYDEITTENRYRGNGAMSFSSKEKKVIFDEKIPNQQKGRKYKLQFWLDATKGEHLRSGLWIRELDQNKEQKFYWHHGCMHNVVTLDGRWALIIVEIEAHADNTSFEISIGNSVKNKNQITVDELMIYPTNNSIFQINGEETMNNGLWFKHD
jgi:hypothetical protein